MQNSERALIIVSDLSSQNWSPAFKWLYTFLENHTVSEAVKNLATKYGKITKLVGITAKKQNFVNELKNSVSGTIKEVDVLISLHGQHNYIIFNDGDIRDNELADKIKNLNIQNKLRMLYSTTCWGALHAQSFVAAGFDCASGAKAINANSPTEYPIFLKKWASGFSFLECLDSTNHPITPETWDNIARLHFYEEKDGEVDSTKVILGNSNITIESN